MILNILLMLIIFVNLLNIFYLLKNINKLRKMISDFNNINSERENEPKECLYQTKAFEKSDRKYIIVHKKESEKEHKRDYTTEVMRDRISSIEHEIFNIKSGKLFTVLVDDKPLMRLSISADGEDVVDYSTKWDETSRNWGELKLFHDDYQIPVIMKLHEAKRTAEKLNGKVALAEEPKSVVYDYTKEQ